jgi:tetratricopeptide (TPR) repeat protein
MSRSAIRTSALVVVLALSAAAGHAQRPNQGDDDSAALVGEGRAAVKRGAFDRAAKALDQAIALNPRRIEAYVLRAAVYWARKQYRDGVALMRRAQALAPTDEDVLTALGSHLVRAGDAATGVPLLEQVLAGNPLRYDAAIVLGDHWYAAGNWPAAIAALEAYFAYRPRDLANEDARHRVDLGDAYLRDRQPQKARAAFAQALREDRADLRAALGVAWAAAALDCREARARLHELEAAAPAHPEIWLVDGRCALALGDPIAATERAQRYLGHAGAEAAAGHALLGEAYEARGNLAGARRELEAAHDLEPVQRSWAVRLAGLVRRAGDARAAIAMLDRLGAPDPASSDPGWWSELGRALVASDDARGAIARLSPVVAQYPGDAALCAVLARAQLAAGQRDAAVHTLEADAVAATPQAQALLVDALTAVAVAELAAGGAAVAAPMLVRAARLDPSAAILRDLGIAQLDNDRPSDAIEAFERALRLEQAPIVYMLDARARARLGDMSGARTFYAHALAAAARRDAVEIAIDWAASELVGGDPANAVTALETTAARAAPGPIADRHRIALAEARDAAGIAALRAGNIAKAVELLKAAVAGGPTLAAQCDLALAEVMAGDAAAAIAALKAVTGQRCPFPPPADALAVPILSAFLDGLSPRRAGTALERLTALVGKANGPAAGLLDTAIHVVALEAAGDAYRSGELAQARTLLTAARAANPRRNADDVTLDLTLVEISEGKLDAAIAQLERLAVKSPDAWVALGIAYDRKGEPEKALAAWRQARAAGSRFAALPDWIEAKERFYGAVP